MTQLAHSMVCLCTLQLKRCLFYLNMHRKQSIEYKNNITCENKYFHKLITTFKKNYEKKKNSKMKEIIFFFLFINSIEGCKQTYHMICFKT